MDLFQLHQGCKDKDFKKRGKMKKELVLLGFVIFFVLVLTSFAIAEEQSLLAYWNFNEGNGFIVNSPTGTITQPIWVKGGIGGSALGFNGKSSYFTSSFDESCNGNPFSLELWILPDKNLRSAGILSKYANHGSRCYDLFFDGAVLAFSVGDDVPAWSGWKTVVRSPKDVLDGQFHHIVATYDKSSMKLFVDGVKVSEASETRTIQNHPGAMCIGNDRHNCVNGGGWGEQPNYFKGVIDEVKIYGRALSESEVSQKYDANKNNIINVDCLEGEKRCGGKKIEFCIDNSWKVQQTCDVNCSAITGIPACVLCNSYEKRCSNGNVEQCSYDGIWEVYSGCDYGCEVVNGKARCKSLSTSSSSSSTSSSSTSGLTGDNGIVDMFSFLGGSIVITLIIIIICFLVNIVILVLWIICLINIIKAGNDGKWKALWIVLITVLSLLGIILYFVIGKKSRVSKEGQVAVESKQVVQSSQPADLKETPAKSKKTKSIEVKQKPDQKLLDYVVSSRAKGAKDSEIRKKLIGVGWSKDKVDDALAY